MKRVLLIVTLALAGCSNCGDGAKNATPNNMEPDGGTQPDDGYEPPNVVTRPSDFEFERRVPLAGQTENRLEDPNFGFQNESWFAVDTSNELQRVRRIYEAHSPEDRPIAGIIPSPNTTCLLGRMLWGEGTHRASVWIGRTDDSGEVVVNALGLQPTPAPEWTSAALSPTVNEETIGDREWTRWEATPPARFGWGYLEVCTTADSTVFVGAPSVVDATTTNALLSPERVPLANPTQVSRIRAFESWRSRRKPDAVR